jgi:general nucleoside transport system permease protein
MTAVATPVTQIQSPKEIRRARVLGIFYLVMAAVTYLVFNRGVEAGSQASFGMSLPQDAVQLPDAVVPVRGFTFFVVVLFVFLAAVQLTRGFGKKANVILGVALGIFALAFLAWAAADGSFNMIGMLNSMVLRAVPICLGALAGVLCERVGVINIAIEGMMLMGAFVGWCSPRPPAVSPWV